jgi:cytochrome d ubiquinol oxidase subunit II
MIAAPLAAFAGAFGVIASARARHPIVTLFASAVAVAGVILTAGLSMFPFIMPSSSHPASSLTAWDSVSSRSTLQVMFWVTVFFVPLIALYTSWVYAKLRGTVTLETIRSED